ncbi:DsbA family protein [Salinispirillum sp. LH 10-3-1]|uniref:DsbA family protein n=1 Tax=Salinispirillum sp. LH 10-3-1 TaxID=2952525 RepID=A0AB38YHI9_9GAMM
MPHATLYYAHDPMCSWCYGFSPTWQRLQAALSARFNQEELRIRYLVGGLAPDSDHPMPMDMRTKLEATWHRIENELGVSFNYDFWHLNTPRRSTYNACRAALLARDEGKEILMIAAIQRAYYCRARNPSDADVLRDCAISIGMEPTDFEHNLASAETNQRLMEEISFARRLGLDSFPSLAVAVESTLHPIPLDYRHPDHMLISIARTLGV